MFCSLLQTVEMPAISLTSHSIPPARSPTTQQHPPLPRPASRNGFGLGKFLPPGATNPPGIRVFRKIIVPSGCGKRVRYSSIIIASDDSNKLHVNGVLVGEGGGFKTGRALHVALNKTSNVFAIEGSNTGSAVGVMAIIRLY